MPVVVVALTLFFAPYPLAGHVTDPTGAAIAGARVAITAENDSTVRTMVTDDRGDFTLVLDPGRYTLTVDADGFKATQRRVLAGETAPIEPLSIRLQIAGVSEALTVGGAPAGAPMAIVSATRTSTPLRDVPQSVTVVPQQLIKEQLMNGMADVVRYVPGITAHQGENNRDQLVIRGNSTSADFFVNGVRDDVQYYRDLYNLERIEALKGPNAMMFGRGGAGGVINRVTKQAGFGSARELSLQTGMYGNKRVTGDIEGAVSDRIALRVNGMFEDSDSFRDAVGLRRYGVTPSMTIVPGGRTLITARYEYLRDRRVADRGIPSFRGRPAEVGISTYYGNPDASHVSADVHLASASIEQHVGTVTVRNQTLVGHYDRAYQNFVPGAVSADGSQVALTAYNNATGRTNVFNQTDVIAPAMTGAVRHTLLAGAEFGRQLTDNFRNTGYFDNRTTSVLLPFSRTVIDTPVVFRQGATDADNRLRTAVAAAYVQDQVELSPHVQVVGGVRFDRFDLQYHNNRNGDTLRRPDDLISPRAGIVIKPFEPLSLYGSYSVSYLPSSGDQFSSLTTVTEQVKPEKFDNYEGGIKWDVRPDLSFTSAVYQLDRTNTRSTDPNDPTRIVQTGSQRTRGYELGVSGHIARLWRITGGYAWQDAIVTSATAAAAAGARVAQVPQHTLSLWNRFQAHPRVAAAAGLLYRSDMFATIDDTVTLPGSIRADAAAFLSLSPRLLLQANLENVLDTSYYVNADSNTNISPGAPRTLRIALTTKFCRHVVYTGAMMQRRSFLAMPLAMAFAQTSLNELPANLPRPKDDGGARHLKGMALPDLRLPSTSGRQVNLSKIAAPRIVIYAYPMTGRPDRKLPQGWDDIPGARGCTPETCGFRDHHKDLAKLHAEVFGVSTQDTAYQQEMVKRLEVPFEVLSDEHFALIKALRLPTFTVDGMTLNKRLTMIVTKGHIEQVFYPVFPPDKHADEVIAWLKRHP